MRLQYEQLVDSVQEHSISILYAMEILYSCIKPAAGIGTAIVSQDVLNIWLRQLK